MSTRTNPSGETLTEALQLSNEILKNIELSEIPLSNAALKALRLARLLSDFEHQQLFGYEAGGYPGSPNGISPEVWKLAEIAGRCYQQKANDGKVSTLAYLNSIENLELEIERVKIGLAAARDPDVSLTSANPTQYVTAFGNTMERSRLHAEMSNAVTRLSQRRSFLYNYVTQRNIELKYSTIVNDAFSRIRFLVDNSISELVPTAIQKFSSIYSNLQSNNPEDWSNAVHSCRRILQDLADAVFPSTATPRIKKTNGKETKINLGPDNYVNRLICFSEDNSKSERTIAIIGSHLKYLGERLDAVFKAAQKGSHTSITSRIEADRYVVYTYMVVGDILQIQSSSSQTQPVGAVGEIL